MFILYSITIKVFFGEEADIKIIMNKYSKFFIQNATLIILISLIFVRIVNASVDLPTDCNSLLVAINSISGDFMTLVLAISGLMIVYAALKYITAGGDYAKIGEAQKTIVYGIFGIFIALVAGSVPRIMASYFNVGYSAFWC